MLSDRSQTAWQPEANKYLIVGELANSNANARYNRRRPQSTYRNQDPQAAGEFGVRFDFASSCCIPYLKSCKVTELEREANKVEREAAEVKNVRDL
jgi:hypothetical protein